MPTKPGGGNLPQEYDPDNGQYTDEAKASMLKQDLRALDRLKHSSIIIRGYEPHFPTHGIHNDEYNKKFVELYRHEFKNPSIAKGKIGYLFKYNEKGDKSSKLTEWGYSSYWPEYLEKDIMKNTDFKTVKYDRMSISKDGKHGYLIVKAITWLNNHRTTTCWEVHKDYTLTFTTLVPNGGIYDK